MMLVIVFTYIHSLFGNNLPSCCVSFMPVCYWWVSMTFVRLARVCMTSDWKLMLNDVPGNSTIYDWIQNSCAFLIYVLSTLMLVFDVVLLSLALLYGRHCWQVFSPRPTLMHLLLFDNNMWVYKLFWNLADQMNYQFFFCAVTLRTSVNIVWIFC